MSISTHFRDAQRWAQTNFGEVALGDVRRSRRVVTLAAGWAQRPGVSIPQLSQGQQKAPTCQPALFRALGKHQACLAGAHIMGLNLARAGVIRSIQPMPF